MKEKMWWRNVYGEVFHELGVNCGTDEWLFRDYRGDGQPDNDDITYVQHVDELFENEDDAVASAYGWLTERANELRVKMEALVERKRSKN